MHLINILPILTINLFNPEISDSELLIQNQFDKPQIEFRINDSVIDIEKGIESNTKGTISLYIVEEELIIQDPLKEIGIEITLAKGIRPIKNGVGSKTRVFDSYKSIEKYKFEELIFPAKAGDRIIFKFTNTKEPYVYSIDLI